MPVELRPDLHRLKNATRSPVNTHSIGYRKCCDKLKHRPVLLFMVGSYIFAGSANCPERATSILTPYAQYTLTMVQTYDDQD